MGKWTTTALAIALTAAPASARDTCASQDWLDVCIDVLVSTIAEATHMPGDGTNGTPLAYKDCGDGTVSDLNTGLMWEHKTQYIDQGTYEPCLTDLHHLWGVCDWLEATGPWIDAVNAEAYAGYTDWRLPHVRELQSINDYSQMIPKLHPVFGGDRNIWYWTNTDFTYDPIDPTTGNVHWVVGSNGATLVGLDWDGHGVRAVRNGRCPEGD